MISDFGTLPNGEKVRLIKLKSAISSCEIITYGAALRKLCVPARGGRCVDVVLGFDSLADYLMQDKYVGAIVGRCANRIYGGSFMLKHKQYLLCRNEGYHHLHGGAVGFDKQLWTIDSAGEDYAALTLTSPDGQEGYPGNLKAKVVYRLVGNSLSIDFYGESDADTLLSMTSHSYFNLSGHDTGSALNHELMIAADSFAPIDEQLIPTGELQSVKGKPFDFRVPVTISSRIGAEDEQLAYAHGYDHCYALRRERGGALPNAVAYSPTSGISMALFTDLPGLQLYSGNFLGACPAGKNGAVYEKGYGFCLEPQFFPDAINKAAFTSPILQAGERRKNSVRYVFYPFRI